MPPLKLVLSLSRLFQNSCIWNMQTDYVLADVSIIKHNWIHSVLCLPDFVIHMAYQDYRCLLILIKNNLSQSNLSFILLWEWTWHRSTSLHVCQHFNCAFMKSASISHKLTMQHSWFSLAWHNIFSDFTSILKVR